MEDKVVKEVVEERVVPDHSPSAAKPVDSAKSNTRFLRITVIVLFFIILGLAVFIGYHFITVSHTAQTCDKNDDSSSNDDAGVSNAVDQIDEKVREIAQALKAKAESTLTVKTGENGTKRMAVTGTYDDTFPIYRPENSNTMIALDKSYGFKIDSTADTDFYNLIMNGRLTSDLTEILMQRGFTKYDEIMGAPLYQNHDAGIICMLASGMPYAVSCSSTSWYDQDEVSFINSLAEAYKEKEGDYPAYLAASEADIENSEFTPYQRLTGSLLGAAALFYRTSPDDNWQFFTGTQAALDCDSYNTDILKRAFAGEVCYDVSNSANSTVKP